MLYLFSPSKATEAESEICRSLYKDLAEVEEMLAGCRKGVLLLTSVSVCHCELGKVCGLS